MARALEFQLAIRSDDRLDAVHRERQLRARKNAVQRDEHLIVEVDALLPGRRLGGKLGQDALDLLAFRNKQLPQLVVAVHGTHWLDEKCAARGRHVVHQSRQLALALGLDRHNETVGSDRHDRLLQNLRVGRRGDDLLQ